MSRRSASIHSVHDLFPLTSARDIVRLFERQLDQQRQDGDSLALLSIVLGLVEGQLTNPALLSTTNAWAPKYSLPAKGEEVNFDLPVPISLKRTKLLLEQFRSLVRGSIDLSVLVPSSSSPSRDHYLETLVTRVADMLWTLLTPHTNKSDTQMAGKSDQTISIGGHLQFLPAFLLDKKLDSFGLTFAVLSALSILDPGCVARDIFLTLSEDHSWISVLGAESSLPLVERMKRVEVTWHGKGVDKRYHHSASQSKSVSSNELYHHHHHHHHHYSHSPSLAEVPKKDNWLYLGERNALICDSMHVTLATLVSSLNSAVSLTTDSIPLALIKRQLLTLFHSKGHLARYPMALGNLADLIEVIHPELVLPTASAQHAPPLHGQVLALYHESIASALTHYADGHIYPYLYLAGFYVRCGDWSRALSTWSRAARVVSRYNYVVKEDEEAYKELQEIATELIPCALKQLHERERNDADDEEWKRETGLRATHYRDLLLFYDGICGWEESSRCPIMHIVWARALISCLNKFHPR